MTKCLKQYVVLRIVDFTIRVFEWFMRVFLNIDIQLVIVV